MRLHAVISSNIKHLLEEKRAKTDHTKYFPPKLLKSVGSFDQTKNEYDRAFRVYFTGRS